MHTVTVGNGQVDPDGLNRPLEMENEESKTEEWRLGGGQRDWGDIELI